MATIKIDKDSFTKSVENLNKSVENYKQSVTSSVAQFSDFQEALTGQAYTALVAKVNEELERQKVLVAECVVLAEKATKFAEEISSAESSVSF